MPDVQTTSVVDQTEIIFTICAVLFAFFAFSYFQKIREDEQARKKQTKDLKTGKKKILSTNISLIKKSNNNNSGKDSEKKSEINSKVMKVQQNSQKEKKIKTFSGSNKQTLKNLINLSYKKDNLGEQHLFIDQQLDKKKAQLRSKIEERLKSVNKLKALSKNSQDFNKIKPTDSGDQQQNNDTIIPNPDKNSTLNSKPQQKPLSSGLIFQNTAPLATVDQFPKKNPLFNNQKPIQTKKPEVGIKQDMPNSESSNLLKIFGNKDPFSFGKSKQQKKQDKKSKASEEKTNVFQGFPINNFSPGDKSHLNPGNQSKEEQKFNNVPKPQTNHNNITMDDEDNMQNQEILKKQQTERLRKQRERKQKEEKQRKQKEERQKKQIQKGSNYSRVQKPRDYLQKIIEYADKFETKQDIKTKINNFAGARSDPKEIWIFTKSYIKTIDPKNSKEVMTFSHKIWQYIIMKSIKTSNVRDGFEKMPPKEKSAQAEKNQITTYIMIVNLIRAMGHEQVWLGVFGKTLSMLKFLYSRDKQMDNIKSCKEDQDKMLCLDLMNLKIDNAPSQYLPKQGQMAAKYLSRIDFLTYFLLCLTTFDPVLFFEEIAEKTGQRYDFMPELRSFNHKWSYNQFWCLIDTVYQNKYPAYYKLPFWSNVLSSIYLQLLQNRKNVANFKEFAQLEKNVFKKCHEMVKNLMSEEMKIIKQIEVNEDKYDFDGQEFVGSIRTLGRGIDQREKQMKTKTWQQFRDRNSVIYYFWRSN